MDGYDSNRPLLVGTTGELYQGTVSETVSNEAGSKGNDSQLRAPLTTSISQRSYDTNSESTYFKAAQWSPDGTTLLASSADNILRSFVLPVDLLSTNSSPHALVPYTNHHVPEPVYATAFHPSFALQVPASCLVLASLRSLPLRLLSPFVPGILASYPLVSATTEAYITPHSLLFSLQDPNQFFAGSDSCLSIFDVNRNGEGPISKMRTTPSRRNHTATSGGMKGIVSTMAMSGEGVLAAGTFSQCVGLYDGRGCGDTVGIFSVTGNKEEGSDGNGLTQVLWSTCSRYLCTVERASNGIAIWDVRGTKKRLAWLRGRKAGTQQRLGVDTMDGEVWAGGTDGVVRVWENLGRTEGALDPRWEFQAHNDTVSSTTLHPTGFVLATCSGQRHLGTGFSPASNDVDSDTNYSGASSKSSRSSGSRQSPLFLDPCIFPAHAFDNSMKVWAL